jgi:hypothetical protein
MGDFLHTWAPEIRGRFDVVSYDHLEQAVAQGTPLPEPRPGTYVFADLERLSAAGMAAAVRFRRSLDSMGGRVRVLNEPDKVLRRYDLLRTLYGRWINSFDAYRLDERRTPKQWPVLIRRESDHMGAIGELIHDPAELAAALDRVAKSEAGLKDVIVVEYRETADAEGVYRKYGAFCVDGRLIPRHVLFSKRWCLKDPDLVSPERVAEELRFLEAMPRADEVLDVFKIAHVDYGRIDYSFYGDRLQVWEINTNPVLVYAKSAAPGDPRRAVNDKFTALARDAFVALDDRVGG